MCGFPSLALPSALFTLPSTPSPPPKPLDRHHVAHPVWPDPVQFSEGNDRSPAGRVDSPGGGSAVPADGPAASASLVDGRG